jgi:hypothetical protein
MGGGEGGIAGALRGIGAAEALRFGHPAIAVDLPPFADDRARRWVAVLDGYGDPLGAVAADALYALWFRIRADGEPRAIQPGLALSVIAALRRRLTGQRETGPAAA